MSVMRIFWNLITAKTSWNIDKFGRGQSKIVVSKVRNIGPTCRGVIFRSVLREELDFSGFLGQIRLEDDRKARRDPDNTLLYRPKKENETSIGVLRIVRPKRFSVAKKTQFFGVGGPSSPPSIAVPFSTLTKDFEVLLETTEFILENVQEQMAERFQLQETFGDFNVFFFGKRAEIYTYSGSLLNADGNLGWRNQFLDNYEKFLRGTKAAELKARVYLLYDDVVREGFVLSAGIAQNSFTEGVVKFTFTMLITGKRILTDEPKNPKIDPIQTLAGAVDPRTNITEFQYFRREDPEVPGVRKRINATAGLPLVRDDSIPGDNAPSDLKNIMMTRSLDALNQLIGVGEIQEDTEQAIDHDILIDFIDEKTLSRLITTSAVITGARTKDVENLTGEQIIAKLISGAKKVGDLRLRDAVIVAESLSRTHSETISEKAEKLTDLKNFFPIPASDEPSEVTGGPRIITATGPDVSFAQLLSKDREYILPSSKNNVSLKVLVDATKPLRDFSLPTTNDVVTKNIKVESMTAFLDGGRRDTAEFMQFYVSTFALLPDPTKTGSVLFKAITENFPEADTLGGKKNAIDFVKDQRIEKFQKAAEELPVQVKAAFKTCKNDVLGSGFFKLLESRAPLGGGPLAMINENTLNAATFATQFGPSASLASANFIFKCGVMISALATSKKPVIKPMSTDALGGAQKGVGFPIGETYFTKEYIEEITIGKETDSQIVSMDVNKIGISPIFAKSGGGFYLEAPFGNVNGPVTFAEKFGAVTQAVIDSGKFVFNTFAFFAPTVSGFFAGDIVIERPSDIGDGILHDLGYIRLTDEQAGVLLFTSPSTHIFYYLALKRKNPTTSGGSTRVVSREALNISPRHFWTGKVSGVGSLQFRSTKKVSLDLLKFPIDQKYLDGNPVPFEESRMAFLDAKINAEIGFAVESQVEGIIKDVEDEINKIINNPDIIVESDSEIRDVLAIGNFKDFKEITTVVASLSATGVTVKDYLQFGFISSEQKKMADKLLELQTLISSSIDDITGGQGGRADQVEKQNREVKDFLCE